MIVVLRANIGTRNIIAEEHYRENPAAADTLARNMAKQYYDYFCKEDIEISYTPDPFWLRIDSYNTSKFLAIEVL